MVVVLLYGMMVVLFVGRFEVFMVVLLCGFLCVVFWLLIGLLFGVCM